MTIHIEIYVTHRPDAWGVLTTFPIARVELKCLPSLESEYDPERQTKFQMPTFPKTGAAVTQYAKISNFSGPREKVVFAAHTIR